MFQTFLVEKNPPDCNLFLNINGTNPASAHQMAGIHMGPINIDKAESINLAQLKAKAEKFKDRLAYFMLTLPSIYEVFE